MKEKLPRQLKYCFHPEHKDQMKIENTSIVSCIEELYRDRVVYMQPKIGNGLVCLHQCSTEGFPASSILSVRKLVLQQYQVIPFHMHQRKEKLYCFEGDPQGHGHVEVFMYEDDTLKAYSLRSRGDRLVIPPATPHAVICWGVGHGFKNCEILVVASSKDAEDIFWQPGVEELLQNRHLQKTQ